MRRRGLALLRDRGEHYAGRPCESAARVLKNYYLREGLPVFALLAGMSMLHLVYSCMEFPKIRGAVFGILIIRILLFRVLY